MTYPFIFGILTLMENTTQPIIPSEVATLSQTEPSKQTGYFLPAIVAVIVLVIISVGGYFLYQKQIKPTPTPQQTSQPTPSPTDASGAPTGAAETANWKTYTNTDYNYQLKYPPTWKIETPSNTSGIGKPTVYVNIVSDIQFKNECCFPYSIGINVYEKSENKTIQELGQEIIKDFKYTEETLNDMKIYRTNSLSSQFGSEAVFVKIDKNNYVSLALSPFNNDKPFPNQEDQYEIFNQILSTFKFLDQN